MVNMKVGSDGSQTFYYTKNFGGGGVMPSILAEVLSKVHF
jgi:hypothetical protein